MHVVILLYISSSGLVVENISSSSINLMHPSSCTILALIFPSPMACEVAASASSADDRLSLVAMSLNDSAPYTWHNLLSPFYTTISLSLCIIVYKLSFSNSALLAVIVSSNYATFPLLRADATSMYGLRACSKLGLKNTVRFGTRPRSIYTVTRSFRTCL